MALIELTSGENLENWEPEKGLADLLVAQNANREARGRFRALWEQ
jgi:hypothetical protein